MESVEVVGLAPPEQDVLVAIASVTVAALDSNVDPTDVEPLVESV
jgi:hypothetical protein